MTAPTPARTPTPTHHPARHREHRRLAAWAGGLVRVWLVVLCVGPVAGHAAPVDWPLRLQAELARVDKTSAAEIGVYVRDLDSGQAVSHRAQESWYLASMVKLPIALAVMQAIDRGDYSLDTPLTLKTSDYVDGGGFTNRQPAGSQLSLRYLLAQMMVHSDNTASDMLIDLVGIDQVNRLTQRVVPGGLQTITHLVDVRRLAYRQLDEGAMHLTGTDFLQLQRQRTDAERLVLFSHLVGTPQALLSPGSVSDAYEAYYRTRLNSGRLDAYGELLAQLAEGSLLSPASTRHLLRTMQAAQTGQQRIRAGLPPGVVFAHKTGTQRARTCDAGITSAPASAGARRLVVVACVQGERSLPRAERALKAVGEALCRAGLFTQGDAHAPTVCTVRTDHPDAGHRAGSGLMAAGR